MGYWHYGLLALWAIGIMGCWHYGLLALWAVGGLWRLGATNQAESLTQASKSQVAALATWLDSATQKS
jgi:hypothetical protein